MQSLPSLLRQYGRAAVFLCLLCIAYGCHSEVEEEAVVEAALLSPLSPTLTVTERPTGTPAPTRILSGVTPTLSPTSAPPATATATPTPTQEPELTPTLPSTPTLSPSPSPTVSLSLLIHQEPPGALGHPTLTDLWEGRANFVLEVEDTGLPMGESETIVMRNGELWSYVHASDRSAGVRDRCGDPVAFPGCVVLYRSYDGGYTFRHADPPVCLFDCHTCPCDSETDHIDQQQYPRVAYDGQTLFLVYEYRGRVRMRRSLDGLTWGEPERFIYSTIWKLWFRGCYPEERIHEHPFVPYDYECLAGGPPGILVEAGEVYVFMALGQNPSSMGCYRGGVGVDASKYRRCEYNPLFTGSREYGPLEEKGPQTNPYFDFRTISSAEVQRVGAEVYMLYEGVRGPGPGDPGDTQFGLGLARSTTGAVDAPWETFPGNPILVDLPGNIGLGHADLVVIRGQTVLYTSLDGVRRSRLLLVWK